MQDTFPFVCVACHKTILSQVGENLVCRSCGASYPIINHIPILLPPDGRGSLVATVDGREVSLDEVQHVYDRAYQHDGLMGTDLDREYDEATKRTLLGFAAPLAGKRLLDVGTGVGSLWDYVPADVEGHALDVSLVGMSKAIQRRPHLTVSVSAAEVLPYPDTFFDVVVAADTIEHTFNPEHSLSEIRRVLRPGGDLCASFPVCDSLRKWGWNRLVRQRPQLGLVIRLGWVLLKRVLLFGRPIFQPIDRDKDAREWVALIEELGLSVAEVVEWPGPPQVPIVYLVHAVRG